MTNKELIELLSERDPEQEVIIKVFDEYSRSYMITADRVSEDYYNNYTVILSDTEIELPSGRIAGHGVGNRLL